MSAGADPLLERLDRFSRSQARLVAACAAAGGELLPFGSEQIRLRALSRLPERVNDGLRIAFGQGDNGEHLVIALAPPELEALGIAPRTLHEAPESALLALLEPWLGPALQRARFLLGDALEVGVSRLAQTRLGGEPPWCFVMDGVAGVGALQVALSTELVDACARAPMPARATAHAGQTVVGWDLRLNSIRLPREVWAALAPGDCLRVARPPLGADFDAALLPHREGLAAMPELPAFSVALAVAAGSGRAMHLRLSSNHPERTAMHEPLSLDEMTVPVTPQLPVLAMSLQAIECATPGTLVDTGLRLEDAEVGLWSAGQRFARGRLVLVGEHLGIELTHVEGSAP